MHSIYIQILLVILLLVSCSKHEHKTVVCIPVYGQSLALGEETSKITDLDNLNEMYGDRIVSENLGYDFGFYDDNGMKRKLKRLINYEKRSHEVSVYGMAESLVKELGIDTLVCIFAAGRGATPINHLGKGSDGYNDLINDIKHSYEISKERGYDYYIPAVCWMQGESDMFDYTHVDYKGLLKKFSRDINNDIKNITGQTTDVKIICYQTNLVTTCYHFEENSFECYESSIPQAQMELIRDDSLFVAGTPTYPFSFARELKHIDAVSQKRVGYYNAIPALDIIRNSFSSYGVFPIDIKGHDNEIRIIFNIPCPPLSMDTINVCKIDNYGFKVITPNNEDILSSVKIKNDTTVILKCYDKVEGSKVKYAVNGMRDKSGWKYGPRGNLRDSRGDKMKVKIQNISYPLHNWCFQFDQKVE